jgi:hypothetical protein
VRISSSEGFRDHGRPCASTTSCYPCKSFVRCRSGFLVVLVVYPLHGHGATNVWCKYTTLAPYFLCRVRISGSQWLLSLALTSMCLLFLDVIAASLFFSRTAVKMLIRVPLPTRCLFFLLPLRARDATLSPAYKIVLLAGASAPYFLYGVRISGSGFFR